MLRPIDVYFSEKEEPEKSCLLFMRSLILQLDENLTEAWKYGMPMYCYGKKMFCYLWIHKKYKQPYLGIVDGNKIDHPDLLTEKRARMKILLLDPERDLPVKKIEKILRLALRAAKAI
jgi:hypothetical protein